VLCPFATMVGQPPTQDTFRGAPFLSSESEVRLRFEVKQCKQADHDEKTCGFEFSVLETKITGLLTFQRDALVDVSGAFQRDRFAVMRDAFSERYGKPISQTDEQILWTSGTVKVELDFIQPKDSKVIVGSDRVGRYTAKLDFAVRKHALRLESALAIFKINFDRHEYERAKDKADYEYEKDCDAAKIESDNFKPPLYSSFSMTVSGYADDLARRRGEEARKGAAALK
jgi:hypothetical protein